MDVSTDACAELRRILEQHPGRSVRVTLDGYG
jgi:hypothetical protein